MRFSVVRTALAVLAGVAISSCSENPISTVKPVEVATPQFSAADAPPIRISEIHYDNAGTDTGEGVEISAPDGTSLVGWRLVFYNGNPSQLNVSLTRSLTGTIPTSATCGERGAIWFPIAGIQNGGADDTPEPDGVALVNPLNEVIEFLSYEGSFTPNGTPTAANPAGGMISKNIGVVELTASPVGESLQRTTAAGDWVGPDPATINICNDDGTPPPPAVVHHIVIDPATATVYQGSTQAFTAKAYTSTNAEIPGTTFTWSSTAPIIASVDDPSVGVATGRLVGSATIMATAANGVSGEAALEVTEAPPVVVGPDRIVEIHYDNASGDVGEAIEVEGPADMVLTGWTLELYNLTGGARYATLSLSSATITVCGTRAVASIPAPAIQNGPNDGIALVSPTNQVVEFLSYEGTLTATNGPAAGQTSTNIPVEETDVSPVGYSVQRSADNVWYGPEVASFGACNTPPVLSTATIVINEIMENPLRAAGGASWGEWFEVHNYGATDIDLQGFTIASQGAGQVDHVISSSVIVPAGGYAVLGRGSDVTLNGGVELDYNYFTGSATTHFLDTADRLELRDAAGARVDIVTWATGGFSRGVSRGVRNALLDNSNAGSNTNWGYSNAQFGDGDFGTPGAANGTLTSTPPAVPNFLVFSGRTSGDAPLPVGFEAQVFASLTTSSGATVSSSMTWEALTPAIASIDSRGVIRALAPGAASFRATASADGTTGIHTLPMIIATTGDADYANNAEFGEPTDADNADDYIVRRAQYTSSYNPFKNIPNWVAYNLEATHIGAQDRCNCFTFDPELPSSFFHYTTGDYTGAGDAWAPGQGIGIDRGHLARSFDRTSGSYDNATTFYFTNIIPQFSDNNQGPWALFENYLGAFAQSGTKEVYIIAGATGNQGTVKNEGKIVIPTQTWKVAVVMDRNEGLANVQSQSDIQVFAVIMPNTPGIRGNGWEMYTVTVDQVEALSGYDVLALLDDNIENAVESNTNVPLARTDGPYTSSEGGSVSLSGAASSDADGDALTYAWSFGDGSTATGSAVTHTYSQDGTFTVQLTVTDTRGISNTTSTTATVSNVAPSVTITHGATLLPGETYTSAGSFTDPGADTWTATVDYGDGSGVGSLALAGNAFAVAHQYNAAGTFTVTVNVSDDDATGSATQTVVVIGQGDAVQNLLGLVTANSLRSKLQNAKAQIAAGNNTPAANLLVAFINEVEDMVRLGRMSSEDGARLINDARRIIQSLIR